MNRRTFLHLSAATAGMAALRASAATVEQPGRLPVIDITDLYHPPQDPGDNFDLIAAYGLPEVDLRAVILDVSDRYRRPYVNKRDHRFDDPSGGRDPGFIPVQQLNYLFDRDVPTACAPFSPMRAPADPMWDAPKFQQAGIELIMQVLRDSESTVEVVSFGSARPIAVAYNREPNLLRKKVRRLHLCMGTYPSGSLEWNVQLDVHAFVRVIGSDLPVTLYACGTGESVTEVGRYNTYWKLNDLSFVQQMDPRLQRYVVYAFERSARPDFLGAMDEPVNQDALERVCARPHNVWETAVWAEVCGREIVKRDDAWRLMPRSRVRPEDERIEVKIIPGEFKPKGDGDFRFDEKVESRSGLFFRQDPHAYEAAAREALPDLYCGFGV